MNFTTSLIDDRYTHQCSDKIVMFGPAATLLAGRMIGLGRVVIKRPNSSLVFCVISSIPGWLATSYSYIEAKYFWEREVRGICDCEESVAGKICACGTQRQNSHVCLSYVL